MGGRLYVLLSLFGATVLCVGLSGCAMQHDDTLRLNEELARARGESAWQQTRAAELESRIARLEQRTGEANGARSAEELKLLSRLDHLLEMNERLIAERAAAPAPGASATPPPNVSAALSALSQKTSAPAPVASSDASEALTQSQEQQLRALVESMRGHPGSPHGGLTREQEAALRILMRPERKLDTENPWPAAFY